MLTERQSQLLEFIKAYQRDNGGVSPSYSEMMKALGGRSKSPIHFLVKELIQRGHIRQLPGAERAIEIVDKPTLTQGIAKEIVASLDRARRKATTPETAVDEVAVVSKVLERALAVH